MSKFKPLHSGLENAQSSISQHVARVIATGGIALNAAVYSSSFTGSTFRAKLSGGNTYMVIWDQSGGLIDTGITAGQVLCNIQTDSRAFGHCFVIGSKSRAGSLIKLTMESTTDPVHIGWAGVDSAPYGDKTKFYHGFMDSAGAARVHNHNHDNSPNVFVSDETLINYALGGVWE